MSVLSTTPEAETGGFQVYGVTSWSSHHSQWLGVFSSTSHGLDQWFVYTRSSNLYLCQWKPSGCMYSLVPRGKLLALFWGYTSYNMLRPAVICYSTKGLGSHISQGCIVEFQKLVGKRQVSIVTSSMLLCGNVSGTLWFTTLYFILWLLWVRSSDIASLGLL